MKITATTSSEARKLALSAGKHHRAGMQELIRVRDDARKGVRPDLKKALDALCKKEKIAKAEYEPLIRIIGLIAAGGADVAHAAREVHRIHSELRRSETVHPLIIAFAGIADDSLSLALTGSKGSAPSGPVPYRLTVADADLSGFVNGYNVGKSRGYDTAGCIWNGLQLAYAYSYGAAASGDAIF